MWNQAVEGFDDQPCRLRRRRQRSATALNAPRVGIYQSYDPSMDEGWTRWVLDRYQFEYTTLHNPDIKAGKLRQHFDAIILPDQRGSAILDGLDYKTIVPNIAAGSATRDWKRCTSS